MARYITVTETAKLIRKELKKNFAGTKFSVAQRSGGLTICVEWLDGPSEPAVNKIVKRFQGASFDSSIDLQSYVDSTYEGEEVHFGANYVTCRRKKSRVFVEAIVAQFSQRWGYSAGRIKVIGGEQDAWIDTGMDYSEERWLSELLYNTDAKDMYRAYEATEEREQAEQDEYVRNEPRRRVQEELDRLERERLEAERVRNERAREEVRRQQEERRQREQAARRTTVAIQTREQALTFLGLTRYATSDEIKSAFRLKVKSASDGRGGYTVDMDQLVTAKEKALAS